MITQNNRLFLILFSAAFLLLLPLIAMQFTTEVNWSLFDFLVMGTLLFGTGITSELALRKVKKTKHRFALVVAILLTLFIIWAELGVGILGTPFAGS